MATIDDENWCDISGCGYEPNKQGEVTLDIAGSGSRAWSYVLKWNEDDEEDEPSVYLWSYPFDNKVLLKGKTLIVRCEEESGCQFVAEVDKGYDRIEDNDEYYYYGLTAPN